MPKQAAALSADPFLRLVVLGAPKCGKSTTCIATAPGPKYVIQCDGSESTMRGAAALCSDFSFDMVGKSAELNAAVKEAERGVKAGEYKTVILDTLSGWAERLEGEELAASDTSGKGPDGRRAYTVYGRKLRHLVRCLFALPCHVIITSHFVELDGELDGQAPKHGQGIMPLLAGTARQTVTMLFPDVIFLDNRKPPEGRVFVINPAGVWGVGSRNFQGSQVIPADISALISLMYH